MERLLRLLAVLLLLPGLALGASLNGAVLNVQQGFTAGQASAAYALSDAATITVNAALGNVFTVTLGGNRTLGNPSNLIAGQPLTFVVSQPASGGPDTLAFSGDYSWLSGTAPLLNTAASAKTTISCVADTSSTLQCAGGAPAPIQLPGYTVATLPAASAGAVAYVTDQLTTCAAAGAALTGGGAVTCPAFYNGSAWVGM